MVTPPLPLVAVTWLFFGAAHPPISKDNHAGRPLLADPTHLQVIRTNTKNMMNLLEREGVHKRPDFEPMIPIDFDMPTGCLLLPHPTRSCSI